MYLYLNHIFLKVKCNLILQIILKYKLINKDKTVKYVNF